MKKIDLILKKVLDEIKPGKEKVKEIEKELKVFMNQIKSKVKAELFVGGSFAKKTLIKKDKYDIDIFIRFLKGEKISEKLEKVLKDFGNVKKVHGSRDYFQIKAGKDFYFELVPVLKVSNPKQAENITDLSYSHVRYINKKVKSQKILDDIKLAKAFCFARQCYGAESYIKGFSGYSLELLVYYYGSFLKFLREVSKIKTEKTIIDIEKLHKKSRIMMDLNASKLESPIILIDPTYKQRNALACLSKETFLKFQNECKMFLKNPSEKFFEIEKTDLEKLKKEAVDKKYEFVLIETKTNKQSGDIAGTKLFKFYNHLTSEILKYFEIKKKGFNYNDKQSARYFFVVKPKKEILISGPFKKDKENVLAFKKIHRKVFVKKKRLFVRKKIDFDLKKFVSSWVKKNKKKMNEMSVIGLKVLG
ncbi:MAG: hypothetical protein KJ949_01805 [Nanoarchaeota archaeon]|nr:hypothetical protein [Nanoarchaeota archaeon]